jgi:hypothetical protein
MSLPMIISIPKPGVGELIEACAKGEIAFDECQKGVADLGYNTTWLYELVMATRKDLGIGSPNSDSDDSHE